MKKVFIDTDIALDLLAKREPFYRWSASLFTLALETKVEIFISSLSISHLDYLISERRSKAESRKILLKFKSLVRVLSVGERTIELALNSEFKDFEDAIQYHCALENNIEVLLTRNLKDYKKAEISVMTAEDYVRMIKS